VGEVSEDGFSVYLIPETLRVTVLGKRQVGDAVNIEIDAQTQVCRWVVTCMQCLPSEQ
jgi:riboflavin synthase